MTTYAELLRIATEKGYPRSWADTFFRVESRDSSEEEAGAEG